MINSIILDFKEFEWTPVEKDNVPVTVTNAVKQHKAVTSLQAEEAKKQGNVSHF